MKIILPKGCELTKYFDQDTLLPPYLPLPRFLLKSELSLNARLLYGLLLGRTQLSQRNGWVTDGGRVYVIYPIQQMADDLGRSRRTVNAALRELEKAGLLERVRRGWSSPNRIFLRLPEDIPPSADPWRNICASDAQFSSLCGAQNLPPNKNNIEINNFSKKEGGDEPFLTLGEFKNVRLTEGCITRLRIVHPLTYTDGIEWLSRYLKQTGRQYQDHYTILLRWLDEERRHRQQLIREGLDGSWV